MRGVLVMAVFLGCGGSTPKPAADPPPAPPPMAHGHGGDDPPPPLTIDGIASGAAIMPGLGDHHRAVTTTNPEAQTYFDQGLRLVFGFNHDEAARSFARATELDPKCASCFWGLALVLGPNYNVPMLPDRFPAASKALQKAQALAPAATPVEQALIGALAKRYPGAEPKNPPAMQPFNEAYAAAMTGVAKQFPDDLDVQVLAAESLMDVNPWRLWSRDGTPAPNTEQVVSLLEGVLKKAPDHPGANHYYIHAVEASKQPGRALVAAERLPTLMPNAGHIVHMPAHIFQRVGRYADASAANRKAAEVDLGYIDRAPKWGYYSMYLVHNYGFLSFSASMEGRKAESIGAAKTAAKHFPPEMLATMPGMDFFVSEPLLAMVRFGAWDDILATPRPAAKFPTLTALWLHAHGLASAATGKLDAAQADLVELQKLAATIPPEQQTISTNPLREVAGVSAAVLAAAIAQKKNDPQTDALWAAAVAAQDKLSYSEPNDWYYPVRHYQGAALLAEKKYKEAEAVYRADLVEHPANGWALWGLSQALKGQKKPTADVDKQFAKAWANADIKLTSTAFL